MDLSDKKPIEPSPSTKQESHSHIRKDVEIFMITAALSSAALSSEMLLTKKIPVISFQKQLHLGQSHLMLKCGALMNVKVNMGNINGNQMPSK